MATHIIFCLSGAIATGVAIYLGLTGQPAAAAFCGAFAFVALYPSNPNK
jgi:hypothetical protein